MKYELFSSCVDIMHHTDKCPVTCHIWNVIRAETISLIDQRSKQRKSILLTDGKMARIHSDVNICWFSQTSGAAN